MTKLKTAMLATVAVAVTAFSSAPAFAEEGFLGGEISANVAMLNDYRFRGVSLNDENFALQGGFDYAHDSGFYVGTWASNISEFGGAEIEQDIYAGYGGQIDSISYNIGLLLYHYPGGENVDYLELYGSAGVDLGVASASLGAAYAFSSENTGNTDNIYVYADVESAIPDTPLIISAHIGYEDGFDYAGIGDTTKLDWSLGASVNYGGLDFGLKYVDTNNAGDLSDATVVFSVGAYF